MMRDQIMARMRMSGQSTADIAEHYGLSPVRVRAILADALTPRQWAHLRSPAVIQQEANRRAKEQRYAKIQSDYRAQLVELSCGANLTNRAMADLIGIPVASVKASLDAAANEKNEWRKWGNDLTKRMIEDYQRG